MGEKIIKKICMHFVSLNYQFLLIRITTQKAASVFVHTNTISNAPDKNITRIIKSQNLIKFKIAEVWHK